jgi:long-chain acyl-CoA synthetase
MSEVKTNIPWKFLDDYRGKYFSGEWPTLPEMFTISASRFPDRNCFTDFAGSGETRETLTYAQTLAKIK